jgi:transcriptional regulator with XRE-family HTH domain
MLRLNSPLTPAALAEWIERRGFTRADAARELGISSSMLYRLLAGETPIPRNLAFLMIALDKLDKARA